MVKNLPFIVLLCLTTSLPPRLARAVEPATIAAVAYLASSVVSLFDSGASITATEVSQIHKMLKVLHERLKNYDAAFLSILNKLDDMPEIIRTELEHALDRDQGHALLAAIELIVEDVRIMEMNGKKPLADLQHRLDQLQQASRNMMQRNDLNLPYIIAALRTERAFIQAIGVSKQRRTADWEVRKEAYLRRTGSTPLLVEKAGALERGIEEWMRPYHEKFEKVQTAWRKLDEMMATALQRLQERRMFDHCASLDGEASELWRMFRSNTNASQEMVKALRKDVHGKKEKRNIVQEELLLLYRYMTDYAEYTHALLSDEEIQPPKGPKERHRPYLEALEKFANQMEEYEGSHTAFLSPPSSGRQRLLELLQQLPPYCWRRLWEFPPRPYSPTL